MTQKEIEQTEIEAPYELPEGWKWCRLGDVCKTFADGDWIESKDQSESGIRLVQTGNIGNGEFRDKEDKYHYISEETFKKLKCTEIFPGDILISRLPEPVGRSCIIPDSNYKMITAVDCTIIRLFENITCKNWFCYYTQSHVYAGLIHERCTGTTRLRISRKNLGEIPFPLPPTLAEQERIVNRIERMFAKLDQAQEKAQAVLDSFETRKAAILHKAFTGELTANWRKANNVPDDSWISVNMGALSELITKGASPKWQGIQYTDDTSQTLFVTSENVREGYLDLEKEKYLDNKINEIQKRSVLKKGDVLLNIVGASIGRSAIYNLDKLANTNQAVCIIRLNKTVLGDFICYFLNSNIARSYYDDNKVETARANISLANVSDMIVAVPTLPEQQEIVRILDTVLEKESCAKESAQTVLDQIALLKKSILARAFRGEL